MTTTYSFRAGYKKNGIGTTPANAPTVKIVTASDVVLGTGLSPTALTNLPGVYVYNYVGADGLDPIALFNTADTTVDSQDIWDYTPAIAGLIKVVTDKLATMLQAVADKWQWTTEALWLAPTGAATISESDIEEMASRAAGYAWLDEHAPVRRTTMTAAEMEADLTGDDYVIHRGDYKTQSLTGLGDLSARTKLYKTIKLKLDMEDDNDAIIQIEETDGLIRVNGQAPADLGLTSADASLEVTDQVAGNIRWTLTPALTTLLGVRSYDYDIQETNATGTFTKAQAKVKVNADVTRRLE